MEGRSQVSGAATIRVKAIRRESGDQWRSRGVGPPRVICEVAPSASIQRTKICAHRVPGVREEGDPGPVGRPDRGGAAGQEPVPPAIRVHDPELGDPAVVSCGPHGCGRRGPRCRRGRSRGLPTRSQSRMCEATSRPSPAVSCPAAGMARAAARPRTSPANAGALEWIRRAFMGIPPARGRPPRFGRRRAPDCRDCPGTTGRTGGRFYAAAVRPEVFPVVGIHRLPPESFLQLLGGRVLDQVVFGEGRTAHCGAPGRRGAGFRPGSSAARDRGRRSPSPVSRYR